jgi:hypothetical protein
VIRGKVQPMSTKNAIQLIFLTWLPAIALLAVDDTYQRWPSIARPILFAVGLSGLLAWFFTNKYAKK